MKELIEFLNEFTHVNVVYFVGDDWYIHTPTTEYTTKTRDEILTPKKASAKDKAQEN
jgi:hypothetical protein